MRGQSTQNATHQVRFRIENDDAATGVYVLQRHPDHKLGLACAGPPKDGGVGACVLDRKRDRPVAVSVVGDPDDSTGARNLARWRQVRHAHMLDVRACGRG